MSEESYRTSGINLVCAFLVGAAAGAAVAYLTAPSSGRETRERLKDWTSNAGQRATRLPRAVGEAYSRAARAAKDAFNESMRETSGVSDA
jgi:gas vesicle protein